ncbi:hypothetical protein [Tatumella ptyseos]|uniref:Allantoate amidohydrolase n=1 Tax=Tatumella ptyseos TaxID=82987 RepID=A0A2X5PPQ5_9GAMM|nr:hypothetical protein [Tatumella ptyseos]SQK75320.1 allantoate amidohydrolase [Tatumella ptyseos]
MTTELLPVPDMTLAAELFTQLQGMSFDGKGITRDAYGPGEQRAHELVKHLAEVAGFEVLTDAALNLYIILPGKTDRPVRLSLVHTWTPCLQEEIMMGPQAFWQDSR